MPNDISTSFDYLNDPDYFNFDRVWRLLGGDVVPVLDCGDAHVEKRTRKPSLTSIMRQAAKAGVEIAGYEVHPDGSIGVIIGKPVGGDVDGTSSDPKWN
jgi:hypothetical protein